MTKKVIVVGSGFGGLASALRLKSKGYDVSIFEKHPDLGGRARVFKRGNFIFDAGPTVITAPYLLDELFGLFDKDIKKYVRITPLKLWYRFLFNDGSKFDYSGDEKTMEKEIGKVSSKDIAGYKKLLAFTSKIFDKGFTELASVPFNNFIFMSKQVPSLLKLKSYQSVYSLVSNFVENEKLRRVLSMHPLLVGGNPFTTTSIYTLILFLEKKWGIHYAIGGTGKIIEALETLMKEEGIKIHKDSEIEEILIQEKKVTGIKSKGQIHNCNYLVCNSDPPYVYNNLIKNKKDYNFLFNLKLKRMNYSMGLFVYYFGTKKKYENVAHHTICFGESYKEHLHKIFSKKTLSEDISFYLHRPSATDPNMAPENHDAFYVLVPVPNNLSKIDWKTEGKKFKNLVVKKMSETVLPNLKDNVVEDFYLTPDYFENELSTLHGSGFSIQPQLTQSAYFRFHNQSEVFKNLYFVGAGTHPGAGVPGVLSSAKVLDKIL